jgi:putative membrane protein
MGDFRDHAANERTFLAWLRTEIAVVAFGFVIEKFNIFISSLISANEELGKLVRLDRLSGPLGRFEGFALMAAGIVLIVLGYIRFVRNKRLIDQSETVIHEGVKSELIVTIVLTMLVAVYCIAVLSVPRAVATYSRVPSCCAHVIEAQRSACIP